MRQESAATIGWSRAGTDGFARKAEHRDLRADAEHAPILVCAWLS